MRTDGSQTLGFPLCSADSVLCFSFLFFSLGDGERTEECQRLLVGKVSAVWVGNVRCFPVSVSDSRRENQAGAASCSLRNSRLSLVLFFPPIRYCAAAARARLCADQFVFYSSLQAFVSVWAASLSACFCLYLPTHFLISPQVFVEVCNYSSVCLPFFF